MGQLRPGLGSSLLAIIARSESLVSTDGTIRDTLCHPDFASTASPSPPDGSSLLASAMSLAISTGLVAFILTAARAAGVMMRTGSRCRQA